MNQDALSVGLVGTGGVCAGVHYPGLRLIPGVEIAGICEPDETLRQKRQAEWGIEAAFDRMDALLDAIAPDAVCIAVPNVYHCELIFQALDAGCHVLCEKPLGMDFAQTREIYARGKASGRRHMTAFTYRFVPSDELHSPLGADWGSRANSPRPFSALARLGRTCHWLAAIQALRRVGRVGRYGHTPH